MAPAVGIQGRCLDDPLLSSVGSVTAEEKNPTNAIRIVEATMAATVRESRKGNVTKLSLRMLAMAPISATIVCITKTWAVTLHRAAERPSASTTICGQKYQTPDLCLRGRGWHGW